MFFLLSDLPSWCFNLYLIAAQSHTSTAQDLKNRAFPFSSLFDRCIRGERHLRCRQQKKRVPAALACGQSCWDAFFLLAAPQVTLTAWESPDLKKGAKFLCISVPGMLY